MSSVDLYMTSVNSTGLNVPKLLSGFIIFCAIIINSLLVESRESGKDVNLNLATAWDGIGRKAIEEDLTDCFFLFLFFSFKQIKHLLNELMNFCLSAERHMTVWLALKMFILWILFWPSNQLKGFWLRKCYQLFIKVWWTEPHKAIW